MSATHSLSLVRASEHYASVNNADFQLSGSQSFGGWFKFTANNVDQRLVGVSDSGTTNWINLILTGSTGKVTLEASGLSGSVTSDNVIPTGIWVHIFGVYDSSGGTFALYINGEKKTSSPTGSHTAGTGDFAIGRMGAYDNDYFGGSIRNIRFYNIALTQEQVREDMNVDTPSNVSGLVGNWPLNNSYEDTSGNNYDLTPQNAPAFATDYPDSISFVENGGWVKKHKIVIDADQVSGSADLMDFPIVLTEDNFLPTIFSNTRGGGYSLDLEASSSQYASIADASCANLEIAGSQTWECWVKPESLAANARFMAKNSSSLKALYMGGSYQPAFYLQGLTTNEYVEAPNPLVIGVWTHIAGVYDSSAGKLRIYVNGELATELTSSGSATDTNSLFAIGRDGASSANYSDGLVRNCRIWNVARTQAQIKTDMNMDTPSNTTGLQGNWILNNSYEDSSANGYSLTASGAPIFARITPFDGIDLRFSTDVVGKERLAHEIVSWDTVGSTGEVWVKINTLLYNSDTEIYVHYGNSSAAVIAVNEAFGKHQVWPSTYKGVWHLENDSFDATLNNRSGVDTAMGYNDGKIKEGADANGSTSLSTLNDTGLPSGSNARTFMGWINIDNAQSFPGIFGYGTATNDNGSLFALDTNGTKLQFGKYGANATAGNTTLSLDTWYHVVFVVSGTSVQYYLNGVDDGNPTLSGINTTIGGFGILGRSYTGGQSFDGLLDELAILDSVLSIDYVKTVYNNQNNPDAFANPVSNFIPKVIFI